MRRLRTLPSQKSTTSPKPGRMSGKNRAVGYEGSHYPSARHAIYGGTAASLGWFRCAAFAQLRRLGKPCGNERAADATVEALRRDTSWTKDGRGLRQRSQARWRRPALWRASMFAAIRRQFGARLVARGAPQNTQRLRT